MSSIAETAHAAPRYLAGAESDPLFPFIVTLFIIIVFFGGVLYLKLHSLPEHMAHGKNPSQMHLVAVLTLLALFTHSNVFWVLALILAVVKVPDFLSPMQKSADQLERLNDQQHAMNNTLERLVNGKAVEPEVAAPAPVVTKVDKDTEEDSQHD